MQLIPRVINTLCDGALVIGHATSRKVIDGKIAKETIRDMSYLKPKTGTFFRRTAFLYAVSGILLAGALGLGTLMVLKQDRGVSPATVIAKPIEPEKNATVNKGWAFRSWRSSTMDLSTPRFWISCWSITRRSFYGY